MVSKNKIKSISCVHILWKLLLNLFQKNEEISQARGKCGLAKGEDTAQERSEGASRAAGKGSPRMVGFKSKRCGADGWRGPWRERFKNRKKRKTDQLTDVDHTEKTIVFLLESLGMN